MTWLRPMRTAGPGRHPAGYVVALPVALCLFGVWFLHVRPHRRGRLSAAYRWSGRSRC